MAILANVKTALGIYYTEPTKDLEIDNLIKSAKDFLTAAGWPSADLAKDQETPLALQAIIIYCKMAVNTDPTEFRMNPVLTSMIVQARNTPQPEEEETDEAENEIHNGD